MKMIKKFVCLLLMSALVGCGTQQAEVNNEEGSAAVQTQPVQMQVPTALRLSMHKPDTLNPLENRDESVDRILRLIFEPLFVMDNEFNVTPNLAESYTVSSDGKTVTVKLKSGLKWQDGEAITARDIAYSVDVMQKSAVDSCYYSMAENIEGAYKKDDLTAVITYKNPVGAVCYSLCFPIIPRHYYKGTKDVAFSPVGSGSYKLESYEQVRELKLTACDGIKGKPGIGNITVSVIQDEATELQAYEHNIIDAAVTDTANLGKVDSTKTAQSVTFNTNKFEYFGFNMKKRIFSNVNARQAIAHLMPLDDIVNKVYVGKAVQSITPINPANVNASSVGVDTYDYNPNTANTLILASENTKDKFNFTILVNSDNIQRVETAELICESMNTNGLNVSVESVPFEEYQNRLKSGDFDTFLGGVRLRDNYNLYSLLYSAAGENGLNYFGCSDAEMDRLISLCNNSAEIEKYKSALNELNKYCSVQLPLIGIGFRCDALVSADYVKGVKTPALGNVYGNINEWSLSE